LEALLNGKVESGVRKTNNYVIYIFMKPFTSKIQNLTHSNKESDCGCDKSPAKKIGLQGLGAKGNKGYHIGSPAKVKKNKNTFNSSNKERKKQLQDRGVQSNPTKERQRQRAIERSNAETENRKSSPFQKKDACYGKVKSRYKKWPSAYASGALVKCRKVGAANWGNKSK